MDAQVRAAQDNGAFDNLPGAGKPIPNLDQPYDENWWVKQKLREEELPTDALLPTVAATAQGDRTPARDRPRPGRGTAGPRDASPS